MEANKALEALRNDIALKQKKGLPFIYTSVIIWLLILVVTLLKLPIYTQNILVFCCSCPLLPFSWLIGKAIKVDIFSNENTLGKLGFLFTCNQLIYLLIVMWVFNAMPEKMVMVYAMVFGAHLLPYSWLYKSNAYKFFAIILPLLALTLGYITSSTILAASFVVLEAIFCGILNMELTHLTKAAK